MELNTYLNITFVLYFFALTGLFITSKHIIILLVAIEIMFLAINLNFIGLAIFFGDLFGQLFSLFVLTIAASESAIGLSILIVYFRVRGSISLNLLSILKG